MGVFGKILLGFFVGSLCGLVALIYGLVTHHRLSGIIGIIATATVGVIFSLLDKSPFSSLVVSFLVILFNIANNKRKQHLNEDDTDNDFE